MKFKEGPIQNNYIPNLYKKSLCIYGFTKQITLSILVLDILILYLLLILSLIFKVDFISNFYKTDWRIIHSSLKNDSVQRRTVWVLPWESK